MPLNTYVYIYTRNGVQWYTSAYPSGNTGVMVCINKNKTFILNHYLLMNIHCVVFVCVQTAGSNFLQYYVVIND